jgi:hypothetical protein
VNGIVADDFTGDGKIDILVAGNNYAYRSQYGNSDAGVGLLLRRGPEEQFEEIPSYATGLWLTGDVRSIGPVKRVSSGHLMLVPRNNSSLSVMRRTDGSPSHPLKK